MVSSSFVLDQALMILPDMTEEEAVLHQSIKSWIKDSEGLGKDSKSTYG